MLIKYTNESGVLLVKCPIGKIFSKALKATLYAGSKPCLECEYYKKSNKKHHLGCKGVKN